ncbi:MAG: type II toxin-antitoxin system VapC family toxin [Myxococcota bacterium]|nr:type II toxin-antitoxin system VapC family toxin [Myxococcota bacterium]
MIVLDASAAIELLLGTPVGRRVSAAISDASETLAAPHLLDLEIAQVLRRLEARRVVATERAAEALADLAVLDVTRYGHDVLIDRIWELRGSLTAYDAAYVALAEAAGARLLTCDAKLAAASGHRATVLVVR